MGYPNDVASLAKIVKRSNTLDADIVMIVGDLFNGAYPALATPHKARDIMNHIQSAYGVYACLGNHDAGTSYPADGKVS